MPAIPLRCAAALVGACLTAGAQTWQGNHDESKVKPYSLPDPLTLSTGRKVLTAKEWTTLRRPEILHLFETNVYGRTPSTRFQPRFTVVTADRAALGGKAVRKQVTISFAGHDDGPKINVLLYLPARAKGAVPVFMGLNFGGNQTVHADPAIALPYTWVRKEKVRAAEDSRGRAASQWQVERVLDRGYGIVTAYCGDIEPDFDGGMKHGVRGMFLRPGQNEFGEDEWGTIGAWAWGLSRMLDYLMTDKDVDANHVALMGHSRLGKAALWAGARDPRFAIVISNESGEGGAALSKRNFGEDVWRINNSFPHWFARNYRQYANREADLPVDQHMLLALLAPRPVYIASAAEDLHSDPRGEFLAAVHAGPVYELLGKKGLGTDEMPAVHQPIMHTVGYHIRAGKHDVTAYDWDRFCDFAGLHWKPDGARGAAAADPQSASVDLTTAVVKAPAESIAATVLIEEIEKRTGIRLKTVPQPAGATPLISIAIDRTAARPEGYRLRTTGQTVEITGADPRGALFGVGQFLRVANWARGRLAIQAALNISTSPAYPIRGHQLGYRPQANSYDAWSIAQMEQYIRELTFFGVNSIEAIPFHDDRTSPVMKLPRREMNRAMSEICARYGLDYWAWTPADFDLKDSARRNRMLEQFDEFFRDSKQLTALFFPGGDPGSNAPELVFPFLADVAKRMAPRHPTARIWLSLQWFNPEQVSWIYRYLETESPPWFAGLVAGPSSPPIPVTRRRLPKQYGLRSYPDITHNKICQYQVPSWDQAYALTLGREAINPRPAEYANIHNWFAGYTDGFISYSDGVHDDVNKTIWSALSWDPSRSVRGILTEYARVYFHPSVAEDAADGILALEKNWRGVLMNNGAVEATLLAWRRLRERAAQLDGNWRWQMCLLRADYDAYIRRRLLNETNLEQQANAILAGAQGSGAAQAMDAAQQVLNRAVNEPVAADLRGRIEQLCAQLFQSIGLQTSVPKYHASGVERGAILDLADVPLNNRWWLEDEFAKVRALPSEAAKVERLSELAAWEHPGPGSFYDNVGNEIKSPHVMRAQAELLEPGEDRPAEPAFWWWDNGKSRARLSWQATLWPPRMVYGGLDPEAQYVVRTKGYGQSLLRINGERVEAKDNGEFKEFPVLPRFSKERSMVLSWDLPTDEGHLNWRQHSRLAEVWLLKRPASHDVKH